MSEIVLCIQACLWEEWHLTHAILLSPNSWQVNITNNEHVVVATGETIEEALLNAQAKANEGKYNGTIFRLASLRSPEAKVIEARNGRQLLLALGLAKPSAPIKRRI